jgi:aryl-alcohol dehydrogenase-like predicted oxidoreductase
MDDRILENVVKLENLARNELGVKLSQLALAWILRKPGVSSTIVGASRPEQLEENLKAAELELPDNLLDEIDSTLQEIEDVTSRLH